MRRRAFASVRNSEPGRILCLHPDAMRVGYEQQKVDPGCIVGGIGVLCVNGPISSRSDPWGWWDNYEQVLQRFKDRLYCDEVDALLMKFSSPGGDAAGLTECCDDMLKVKEETGKPVYAYADDACYSAAFALACTADEIYLARSAGLGSIGVICAMISYDKANKKAGVDVDYVTSGDRKADGMPDAPISKEARAHVQRRVDQLAAIYWELVSTTRRISVAKVKGFEADTFYGDEAVEAGLADDVMSLDDVLRFARKRIARGQ